MLTTLIVPPRRYPTALANRPAHDAAGCDFYWQDGAVPHHLAEPPLLSDAAITELEQLLGERVIGAEYVTSGAAGNIFRLTTPTGSAIAKTARPDRPAQFEQEAAGLRHIASTNTVPVPAVLSANHHFLLLQDLGTNDQEPSDGQWYTLGQQVARMHSVRGPQFGDFSEISADPTSGTAADTPQSSAAPKPAPEDWVEFFANNRVRCYYQEGRNAELLTAEDRAGIERLIEHYGPQVPPTAPMLCHADLWRENVHLGADDVLYLIDPPVDYTHPESDLATSQMYSRFPPPFYQGYRTVRDLLEDWVDRIPLYQLKELLVMIAQFGHQDSLRILRQNIANLP